jgi:hypothetical protein
MSLSNVELVASLCVVITQQAIVTETYGQRLAIEEHGKF